MNREVTGTPADAAVRDAFIDLVCQDEGLLRAEFDALIASSWPAPPPDSPPPAPPRRPPPGAGPPATHGVHPGRPTAGGTPARRRDRRQRGPPADQDPGDAPGSSCIGRRRDTRNPNPVPPASRIVPARRRRDG